MARIINPTAAITPTGDSFRRRRAWRGCGNSARSTSARDAGATCARTSTWSGCLHGGAEPAALAVGTWPTEPTRSGLRRCLRRGAEPAVETIIAGIASSGTRTLVAISSRSWITTWATTGCLGCRRTGRRRTRRVSCRGDGVADPI